MSVEPGLIDVNVLACAMDADAPQHAASRALLAFLHVLPIPARTVEGWLDLRQRHPGTDGDVFDLQIVAAMQANGIQRIYTFNADDFKVFPELAVLTP